MRRRGLTESPAFTEATGLHSEAVPTPDLTELWPSTKQWDVAERELRRLHAELADRYGPDSPVVLEAAVRRDLALLDQGRGAEAREALGRTQAMLAEKLGPDHRLRHLALFRLGQAHLQFLIPPTIGRGLLRLGNALSGRRR